MEKHSSIDLKCDCSCTILSFDYYQDEPHSYIDIYTHYGRISWLWRLKQAWKILLGKDHYLDALVISKPKMIDLRKFLADALNEPVAPE